MTLIDIITDNSDVVEDLDLKVKLQKLKEYLKDTLTPREMTVIRLRYGLGGRKELPQREVAKKLKISRSYVSRIEKKALEKLKERFQ